MRSAKHVRWALGMVLVSAGAALALGPGDLDPTFAVGGTLAVTFPGGAGTARAIVVQGDGMIVAAGEAGSDVALARSDATGVLDPSFGSGGLVTTDVGGTDSATALVLQPDGKLVVAGGSSSPAGALVARYEADGTLDASFGTAGVVVTPGLVANALVLQPDGKLVIGGPGSSGFMLVRYDDDGTIDGGFGTAGVASTDFAYSYGEIPTLRALALQSDGKLVAVGGGSEVVALARFESDGTLDGGFGANGQVTTYLGVAFGGVPSHAATAVSVRPDATLLIAGTYSDLITLPNSGGTVTIASGFVQRYLDDGTWDLSFGQSGGTSYTSQQAFEVVAGTSLGVQNDDKILVGGFYRVNGSQNAHRLRRYSPNGAGDGTFFSTTNPSAVVGEIRAIALQGDRKILTAGSSGPVAAPVFAIRRYLGGECGDGVPESYEACDDGNTTSGDGCDANCTPTACGNGIVTSGEDCEPMFAGECCLPTCLFAAAGTACTSNGDPCATHACDGTDACTHVQEPAAVCQASGSRQSSIAFAHLTKPGSEGLTWSWKGTPVAVGNFADPTTTNYALCVYEGTSLAAADWLSPSPCSSCWTAGSKGFDYKDKTGSLSGIRKASLRATPSGKGTLKVQAKGQLLSTPSTPLTPPVTVQLRNTQGGCWGADFSAPKVNTTDAFKAKSD